MARRLYVRIAPLSIPLADDIVILNSGAVVFRGAAGEIQMNDAIVAQHLGVH